MLCRMVFVVPVVCGRNCPTCSNILKCSRCHRTSKTHIVFTMCWVLSDPRNQKPYMFTLVAVLPGSETVKAICSVCFLCHRGFRNENHASSHCVMFSVSGGPSRNRRHLKPCVVYTKHRRPQPYHTVLSCACNNTKHATWITCTSCNPTSAETSMIKYALLVSQTPETHATLSRWSAFKC